jgi:hypothetical protein
MYATHPYYPQDSATQWDSMFGYLASQNIAPVIATEFGDSKSPGCKGDWDTNLTQYAYQLHISWTAWAWWPADCKFPALISDWDYMPTEQGKAIKAALAKYPYEPAGTLSAGGVGGVAAVNEVPDSGAGGLAGDGGILPR